GTAIPSVRQFGESQDCPLIRINLREAGRSSRHRVALPMRGLDALSGIAAALEAGHPDA
ncbi:MAG: NAD-dependent deacetylase, partial [Rubrivivax sp.]|nr:NAD-dependent deacetylase [Rubrivivax sp.]